MNHSNHIRLLVLVALVLMIIPGTGRADYKIGPEDILQVSFWQKPTLDQTVTVRQDGKITISIIGEIVAAGLTTSELAKKIGERAGFFDPTISQAAVTVLRYNSQKVFISGQVTMPGPYAFEEMPDVWTLITEAGGVTELADLTKVNIIRGSIDAGDIVTVNVEKLLSSQELDKIPQLYPGDVVEVPRLPAGMVGTGLPQAGRERRNIVYVTGAVGRPGVVNLDEGMDVLDAVAMSGGTGPEADLKHVRVVSKHEAYSSVMTIDLERYSATGAPRRYVLQPEDAIVVPQKKVGFFRMGWGTFRDIAAVTASVISTVVLIDRLGE